MFAPLIFKGFMGIFRTVVIIFCFFTFSGSSFAQTRSQTGETQFGNTIITTSSTLKAQGSNSYAPVSVYDDDPKTAWVEGAASDGTGEWIKIAFEWPLRISTVYVVNGYAKSTKSHEENGRVREAVIETDNGSFSVTLPDNMSEKKIGLPDALSKKKTAWIRLTIKSVYPGTKYKDAALSEFRPDLEEHNYE